MSKLGVSSIAKTNSIKYLKISITEVEYKPPLLTLEIQKFSNSINLTKLYPKKANLQDPTEP
jgi:hypothetical protein